MDLHPFNSVVCVTQAIAEALADLDFGVSARAVGGADFWLDPMISLYWFAGDRAAQILISLGLQKSFQLNQCRFPDTEISILK